jgi:hypothetical protein
LKLFVQGPEFFVVLGQFEDLGLTCDCCDVDGFLLGLESSGYAFQGFNFAVEFADFD